MNEEAGAVSPVRLVVNLHSVPGAAAEYGQAWKSHGAEVAREAGCLQYELFQSISHPDHLAMLELWADRAAFESHWQQEMLRPQVRPELIGAPRTRTEGRDSVEIYWEQAEHRYSASAGLWVPR
jgi:quinol monooxygenase YgiN